MKNSTYLYTILAIVLIASIAGFVGFSLGQGTERDVILSAISTQQSTVSETPTGAVVTGCTGGVSQTQVTYNDQNEYAKGTDPAGNIWYRGHEVSEADDASEVFNLKETEKYVTNWDSTTYFAEEGEFYTGCDSALPLKPQVKQATAPTMTVLNSNGVTLNADENHEDVGATGTAEFEVTVKAPTKACSSRYGAVVVIEYDKTYIENIESTLGASNTPDYLGYTSNQSGSGNDFDGFKSFIFEGELCNGDKEAFTIKTTQTDQTPEEDTNNVQIHWLPVNLDIDQDDYSVIQDVEDEDNNAITVANTTSMVYTA